VSGLDPLPQTRGVLSRRAREELSALQATLHELAAQRSAALRMLSASRGAATRLAQREFWLEFAWADEEYRAAVRRLARFCLEHRQGSRRPELTRVVEPIR
jgi:hypothetical protein